MSTLSSEQIQWSSGLISVMYNCSFIYLAPVLLHCYCARSNLTLVQWADSPTDKQGLQEIGTLPMVSMGLPTMQLS